MKELVRFSLLRRFNNKSTKIFNIIVFCVVACFLFADKIMEVINPTMFEKKIVYTQNIDEDTLSFLNENANEDYEFKVASKKVKELAEEGNLVLVLKDDMYTLYSKYEENPMLLSTFSMYLNAYRKDMIMQNSENTELLVAYNQNVNIKNVAIEEKVNLSKEKSNLIFMFVTGIYFMMISFVSTVASEVVNEKATKVLELILTSVSAKIHFCAKLLVGWLVIVIQGGLSFSYIVMWILIRGMYDQGKGILSFANKIGILNVEKTTFLTLLKEMDLSFAFFSKLGCALLFVLLGVLLIQLIMVIISSFVSSVEEAGNIQAPFYLILLGTYYLVIAINNPHDLNEGIGFYLSFMPFLNMLIMPCRMLIAQVPWNQLLLSLLSSIAIIILILYKGIPMYERGVLDYSCKGFIQVIQAMKGPKKDIREIKNKIKNRFLNCQKNM